MPSPGAVAGPAGAAPLSEPGVLEQIVAEAIAEAMAPFRTPSGGYRLGNEWHYLIAPC